MFSMLCDRGATPHQEPGSTTGSDPAPSRPSHGSFYDRIGPWPRFCTDYWSFHLAGATLTYCANNFADGN